MEMTKRGFVASVLAALVLALHAAPAAAESLMERAKSGKPIRLGFSNEVPWAYPGENNKPLGFANAHTIGVLKKMGFTNIEPVVTEWGSLIPGLNAGRFDVITGGMYITPKRCRNVAFAEPMGEFGDAFIVAKGNPKNIQSFEDIKSDDSAVLVTGAGYITVDSARKVGVPDARIMQVPDATAILQAVLSGRAHAGGVTYFTALDLQERSGGKVDVTDPARLPAWTKNHVGIAFRESDADFLAAFNKAQAEYLGSKEMLEAVAPYKYTRSQLPKPGVTTAQVCEG